MYRPMTKTVRSSRTSSILPTTLMIGGSIVGLSSYIKATLLLKQYGKKIQLHGNDGPVEPSVKLEDMVVEVCEDLSKSISEHTPIRPILIPGTHTKHAGTLGTFQGGIIGLPCFFEFNKREEIDGKIQWDETSATDVEEIYNTFLLSDEAKKYGIAREILLVNTPQVYIDTILPIAISFLASTLATNATFQSEMAKLTSNSRNPFQMLLFIVAIAAWRALHMKLQRYYENRTEIKIGQLGEDYIRGALEYNTKTIKRNLCSATVKDQKQRILNNLSDSVKSLFSTKERASQKVQFYTNLTVGDDEKTKIVSG